MDFLEVQNRTSKIYALLTVLLQGDCFDVGNSIKVVGYSILSDANLFLFAII